MRKALLRRLLLVAGALLVMTVAWHATPAGVGVSPDSVSYLESARSLLLGRGLVVPFVPFDSPLAYQPLVVHAPLYPIVLAGVARLIGSDPLAAARLLNILSAGGLVVSMYMLVWDLGRNHWISAAAVILVLVGEDFWEAHLMAWSEPLFSLLLVGSIWGLVHAARSGGWRWSVLAGLAAGLAVLTRYAGVFLLPAGLLVILVLSHQKAAIRRRMALAFAAAATVVCATWFLGVTFREKVASDVWITYHVISGPQLLQGTRTIGRWLAAGEFSPRWQGLATVVLLSGLTFGALRVRPGGERSPARRQALLALVLLAAAYAGFLVFAMSAIDRNVLLDLRTLFPGHLIFLTVIGTAGAEWLSWSDWAGGVRRYAALAALVGIPLVAVACGFGTIRTRLALSRAGMGYQSPEWRTSALVAAVRDLPPGATIYSNGYEVLAFLTARTTKQLPLLVNPYSGRRRTEAQRQIAQLRSSIPGRDVYLVWCEAIERTYFPDENTMTSGAAWKIMLAAPDGRIYRGEP